jgi:hypothetical protein
VPPYNTELSRTSSLSEHLLGKVLPASIIIHKAVRQKLAAPIVAPDKVVHAGNVFLMICMRRLDQR